MNKSIYKKVFLGAVAAATVLVASSASAGNLVVVNHTGACLRVYADNLTDVPAWEWRVPGWKQPGRWIMLSVFAGGCGGRAVENQWIQMPSWGADYVWHVNSAAYNYFKYTTDHYN